eukprot:gb/GECG01015003.1/.p1 GENE.gb/GECG01015003.1/~~gb/GECG01015003.1/.p1  ORF type:complete len:213 (+),score=29.90 gb/GECG01015003.1/:1-639(+)
MANNQANGGTNVGSGASIVPVSQGEEDRNGDTEEPGYYVEEQLTNVHYLRELNKEGQWTVSGAKMGNELNNMLDEKLDTFWQSDGLQPHVVTIEFHKRQEIDSVAFYVDYKEDESYTPQKVQVTAGTTFQDMAAVKTVELAEPSGWVKIPLGTKDGCMKTFIVCISIISMHQQGRDTRIRQAKIFSPRKPLLHGQLPVPLTTPEALQYAFIR